MSFGKQFFQLFNTSGFWHPVSFLFENKPILSWVHLLFCKLLLTFRFPVLSPRAKQSAYTSPVFWVISRGSFIKDFLPLHSTDLYLFNLQYPFLCHSHPLCLPKTMHFRVLLWQHSISDTNAYISYGNLAAIKTNLKSQWHDTIEVYFSFTKIELEGGSAPCSHWGSQADEGCAIFSMRHPGYSGHQQIHVGRELWGPSGRSAWI